MQRDVFRLVGGLCAAVALTACVTTQPQADGSTKVNLSLTGANKAPAETQQPASARPAVVPPQAPAPSSTRQAAAPTVDWSKAAPLLRAAIECRTSQSPKQVVKAVFGVNHTNDNGDYRLPETLTVFGRLKVDEVSVFDGGEEEGTSFAVKPRGVTLTDVAKAASLKRERGPGGRYLRGLKGGMLEAGQPQPGVVQLVCIRGEGQH